MKPSNSLPAALGEAIVEGAVAIIEAEQRGFVSAVTKEEALLDSTAVRAAIARAPGPYDAGEWK